MSFSRYRWAVVVTVMFSAAVCVAAALEEVWVQKGYVDLREGPGGTYPVVGRFEKGTKLTVLERNDRKWLKVEAVNKEGKSYEGWTHENSISPKKVGGGIPLPFGGPEAGSIDNLSASKGLREEAEAYATSKNMDPKRVDAMIELTKSITPDELAKFEQDGKLGASKPAQ